MTSYAFARREGDGVQASVELKGYNSRFLDITIALPAGLGALEGWVREAIASRAARGKIECLIRLRDEEASPAVTVNLGAARAYREAADLLAARFGVEGGLSLDTLFRLDGLLDVEPRAEGARARAVLEPLLCRALDQFEEGRLREGAHTQAHILALLDTLESAARGIAANASALEAALVSSVRARFAEVLPEVDEARVLSETAALLVRCSIAEELSRLEAHFADFRAETARSPSPGKKLDFLCQELGREINTIGSKTPSLDTSRAVITMKDALENIREELHNVE
ncbi:MAG: YicC family protein [Treponema sp.]|nr:YicC family protein [Treponema sp.]